MTELIVLMVQYNYFLIKIEESFSFDSFFIISSPHTQKQNLFICFITKTKMYSRMKMHKDSQGAIFVYSSMPPEQNAV